MTVNNTRTTLTIMTRTAITTTSIITAKQRNDNHIYKKYQTIQQRQKRQEDTRTSRIQQTLEKQSYNNVGIVMMIVVIIIVLHHDVATSLAMSLATSLAMSLAAVARYRRSLPSLATVARYRRSLPSLATSLATSSAEAARPRIDGCRSSSRTPSAAASGLARPREP